jgi:hypothetical protein
MELQATQFTIRGLKSIVNAPIKVDKTNSAWPPTDFPLATRATMRNDHVYAIFIMCTQCVLKILFVFNSQC